MTNFAITQSEILDRIFTFQTMESHYQSKELISLHGTDTRLYELVARLVMDPHILRLNNNYPFKTSPQYTWHIYLVNGEVAGFMPAKMAANGLYVDNYYIRDDDREVLENLICNVLSSTDRVVTALCHKRHTEAFRSHGFIICTVFAQYNKMQSVNRKGEFPR